MDWFSTPIPGTNCCHPGGRFDSNWYCGQPCEQLTTAGWVATVALGLLMLAALVFAAVSLARAMAQ